MAPPGQTLEDDRYMWSSRGQMFRSSCVRSLVECTSRLSRAQQNSSRTVCTKKAREICSSVMD
uniref:Uncharacterized protein n=1 Tax=Pristionchus pacificus TaxID=54126 RepID=A0A2A6BRC9_PRIPA|eukprot:PDM68512.1 hypothetical protein PRIPAC_44014 [Pristionchus pacificus]